MNITEKFVDMVTSGFGAGSLQGPKGTWGSLVALPFAWFLYDAYGTFGLFTASMVCAVVGVMVIDSYVRRTNTKDPSFAVIDEIAGQWLTLVFLTKLSFLGFGIGFFLFRFFDILKPPPCRRLEKLPEGLGVMLDDLAAGIYAGLCLYLLQAYKPEIFIF